MSRSNRSGRDRASLPKLPMLVSLAVLGEFVGVVASQAGSGPDLQPYVYPSSAPQPIEMKPIDPIAKYVGISSCAMAACHGGTRQDTSPDRTRENRSAYRVWVEQDKHADAYLVLFRHDSKEMARRLGLDPHHMEKATRCLTCHGNVVRDRSAAIAQEDGVSCESCHGAAGGWKDQHWLESWRHKPAEEKSRLGMKNLRFDLVARAQVCVDCHVGSPDREVDHDLIAAGHPRLNFEFAAFHEILPHHWNRALDRETVSRGTGAPFDASLWIVGQVVASRAAARMLENRVGRLTSQNERSWPELSEYDCYACHHQLIAESPRQHSPVDTKSGRPGMPRPSSWYFAMLGPIRDELGWTKDVPNASAIQSSAIGDLGQGLPSLVKIRMLERSLANLQSKLVWSQVRPSLPVTRERLKALFDRATRLQVDNGAPDWDQVAQAYLAAVPLRLSLQETSAKSPVAAVDAHVKQLLNRIIHLLEFPASSQSPSEADWEGRRGAAKGQSAIERLKEFRDLIENEPQPRRAVMI